MFRLYTLIIVLICLLPSQSIGQNAYSSTGDPYLLDSWTVNNGLPQSSVNAILQGGDGYLWLGTFGGLVRFDGFQFDVISRLTDGSERANRVISILEGREGIVWVGTEASGVLRYQNGALTPVLLENGREVDGAALTMTMDSSGNVWIGMMGKGLFRVAPDGKGSHILMNSPLQPEFSTPGVTSLWTDADGSVWIGGAGAIAHLQGAGLTMHRLAISDSNTTVVAVGRDSSDVIWCTTSDRRLFRISERSSVRIPEERLRSSYAFDEVADQRRPEVFLAGQSGLLRYHNGRFYKEGTPEWTQGKIIRASFVDREGNVWFASNTDGLIRFRRATFSMHNVLGSVQNTTSVTRGKDGTIWVGLNCGGVGVLKDGIPVRHPVSDLLNESCVWSILEDRRGVLWVGTWGLGVFEVDPRRPAQILRQHWKRNGFPADIVVATMEASDGAMWFGTVDGGLIRYAAGRTQTWKREDGLPSNEIRALFEESPGRVWIGTNQGLALMENNVMKTFGPDVGMPVSPVRVIVKDSAGIMWFGTYGSGLVASDGIRFVTLTTREGLFDNIISHVVQDRSGFVWMGCNRGIWKSPIAELHAVFAGRVDHVNSTVYGLEDGLTTLETNGGFQPTNARTEDGDIWIPTTMGVARIRLTNIRANLLPPPVHIEKISLDGIEADLSMPIHVKYGIEDVAIEYTALSFITPKKIQFRHILSGFNRDWVQAGDRREALYSNVSPGTYRFRVVAANNDGVWNEEGAEVTLVFETPYWESWWFRLILVAVLMGMGMLVVSARLRSVRLQKEHQEETSRRLIENQEEERQRIAGELHDGLGQELIVAKNRVLLTAHHLPEGAEARKEILQVAEALTNALKSVRSIAYNLRPFQLDRLGLSETLRSTVRTIQQATPVTFETEIANVDGLLPHEAEIGLFRILQETLTNVVKHSAATRASVIVSKDENTIVLRVQDDGKGFEHGVTADGQPAYGFGLSSIIERVRMLDGMYKIASVPGKGTTIAVRVPVNIPDTMHIV